MAKEIENSLHLSFRAEGYIMHSEAQWGEKDLTAVILPQKWSGEFIKADLFGK
jgi:hypothetical protein